MYKKFICIALTFIIALNLGIISVSAQVMHEQDVKVAFINLSIQGMTCDCDRKPVRERTEVTILGYENEWTIFHGYNTKQDVGSFTKRIGPYIFSNLFNYPCNFALYGIKNDEIICLEELYNTGQINNMETIINEIEKLESNLKYVGLSGDANSDNLITITDALEIQKALASFKNVELTLSSTATDPTMFYYHDFNYDDEITTQDVLSIQSYLANAI